MAALSCLESDAAGKGKPYTVILMNNKQGRRAGSPSEGGLFFVEAIPDRIYTFSQLTEITYFLTYICRVALTPQGKRRHELAITKRNAIKLPGTNFRWRVPLHLFFFLPLNKLESCAHNDNLRELVTVIRYSTDLT